MELIVEFVMEIFFGIVSETAESRKFPKNIRYAAATILVMLYLAVMALFIFMVFLQFDTNPLSALFYFVIGVLLFTHSFVKFKKTFSRFK